MAQASNDRPYGGVPAERRRAERRARLTEAALTIIGDHGAAALTVNKVSRVARLNERYFYECFGNMDDLLVAVADYANDRLLVALAQALDAAGPSRHDQATAAIGAGVAVVADDPRLARLMLEAAVQPVLARMRSNLNEALVALIVDTGLRSFDVEPTPDRVAEASFAATMLLGGLSEVLASWVQDGFGTDRATLVQRCVRIFLAVGDAVAETSS